jgi:hypothetical protein
MKTNMLVRWILEIFVLEEVWRHSHWSVALTLTLFTVRVELQDCVKEIRRKNDQDLKDRLFRLAGMK